jgi:hypothetical protein
MRFSLIDLLIATACGILGYFAVLGLGHILGFAQISQARVTLLGILVGLIFYLILTPPIYRHFGLLPLFLPSCPHCRRRPGFYRVLDVAWPRVRVACGACGQLIDIWWMQPAASEVSKDFPSLLLSWPHSIGRWRRLSGEGPII